MAVTKVKSDLPHRKISFAAPDQVHGIVKYVVAWAEMNGLRHNGKTLTERDFLNALVAGFYNSGQSNWIDRIESDIAALDSINAKQSKLASVNKN